ncbi:hypothetical protein P7K49_037986 [Saguinus oedipus]|uniref:Uncharacterized protein n=1 Tax=Saguinus oedipus TaxID=9490 RepID=A0ABQ9TDW2_SAGOE|nr:hypothetical protein P7K49_037986 [Saguinus oedipus]
MEAPGLAQAAAEESDSREVAGGTPDGAPALCRPSPEARSPESPAYRLQDFDTLATVGAHGATRTLSALPRRSGWGPHSGLPLLPGSHRGVLGEVEHTPSSGRSPDRSVPSLERRRLLSETTLHPQHTQHPGARAARRHKTSCGSPRLGDLVRPPRQPPQGHGREI